MAIEDIIKSIPKVEQHVHIVGSMRPETLLRLVQQSDLGLPYETLDDIYKLYHYPEIDDFFKLYTTVNDVITHEKIYETITYEMLQNHHSCNVHHVECIFSAYDHIRRGLDFTDMVFYINKAIRKAHREFGISCNIRVDLVRNYGPAVGMQVLDLIVSEGDNIVSIDTGGAEIGFPQKHYAEVYKKAREQGLRLVTHHGEGGTPENMWESLEYLKPERIGHGMSGASDMKLLKEVARKGISIEVCPTSNLMAGHIPDMSKHPIRKFMETGIKVSINTDDPPMFHTDMNKEFLKLHQHLGFTPDELFSISLDSIETSFISDEEKEAMVKEFTRAYGK